MILRSFLVIVCRRWVFLVCLLLLGGVLSASQEGLAAQQVDPEGVTSDVRDQKIQNMDDLNRLILKYGIVRNRSANASLKAISLRLGPYFDHPEFKIRIVILDRQKPIAYLLKGQTLVLSRGMIYSGLLENTDEVAGVLAYLLSERMFAKLGNHFVGASASASSLPATVDGKEILDPVLYAALAMVQAGYHYQGIISAVELLGTLRSDPVLGGKGKFLLAEKLSVLKGSALYFEGQIATFVHHNMTAIYDLSRFLARFPLSAGGHFLLGLAYYQSFSESRFFHPDRFLFVDDPIPTIRIHAIPLDIGALDAAESEWEMSLQLNPAFVPALNAEGRLLLLKGERKEARSYFRRAYNLIPDSPWYAADYGLSLLMENHRISGARLFEKAVRKASYDPRLLYDEGLWSSITGDITQSRDAFGEIEKIPGWREVASVSSGVDPNKFKSHKKEETSSMFTKPGVTMEEVTKALGIPKTPPVIVAGRTVWNYNHRGIRLIFHKNILYYTIFEKASSDRFLGALSVGEKYDPEDPLSQKPSWVIPLGRTPVLVFKTDYGYVTIDTKDGIISRVLLSALPKNETVEQDRMSPKGEPLVAGPEAPSMKGHAPDHRDLKSRERSLSP
jgi:tetratricopeptide (TPR) repeat protein